MDLSGKTAVVTAAGQGIGRAIATRFVAAGARTIAIDIDAGKLSQLRGVEPMTLDLTDRAAIVRAAGEIGDIDVLANVAGFVHAGSVLECDEDAWSLSFLLNVDAMYRLTRALIPGMLRRGGGSIVNVSSVASSIKGVPNRFAYGTTKAAVIGLTKAIAADFVGQGVRCNVICPGTIASPSLDVRMAEQAADQHGSIDAVRAAFVARQPMGRLGTPEEIASMALYLSSDEASFITGAVHIVDGGWAM